MKTDTVSLIVVEFLILAVVTFFVLRYYQGRMVTWDVSATVYLSWVLGFAGVLLLPYDMSITIVLDKQSIDLRYVWEVTYWSTFALAWILLPLQMEYHGSGHFSVKEKMWDSFKKNGLAGLLAIVAVIIYIIAMAAANHESPSQVVNFLMAMSYTYGAVLIALLMGSGLVSLPRRLWQISNPQMELNCLYITASSVESSFQEARFALEDAEIDVKKAVDLAAKWRDTGDEELMELKRCVGILEKKAEQFAFSARSASRSHQVKVGGRTVMGAPASPRAADGEEKQPLGSKDGLIALHVRLISAQTRAASSEARWLSHLERAKLMEDMLKTSASRSGTRTLLSSSASDDGEADSPAPPEPSPWALLCNKNMYKMDGNFGTRVNDFLAHTKSGVVLMKYSYRALSIVCALFSVLVLWSEMMMGSTWESPFAVFMNSSATPSTSAGETSDHLFTVQMISFVALCYMSICTYWSLFRINIGWAFKLQGPNLSTPTALIFNGEYFSRLQFSLGYNFLVFLHIKNASNTAFMTLMENAETVPLFGASMSVYVPVLMGVVALLTFFNGITRLYKCFGIESDDVIFGSDLFKSVCCFCYSDEEGAILPTTASSSSSADEHRALANILSEEDLENLSIGKKLVTSILKRQEQQFEQKKQELTAFRRSSGLINPTAAVAGSNPATLLSTGRISTANAGKFTINDEDDEDEDEVHFNPRGVEMSRKEPHGGAESSSFAKASGLFNPQTQANQKKPPKDVANKPKKDFSFMDDDEGDGRSIEDLIRNPIYESSKNATGAAKARPVPVAAAPQQPPAKYANFGFDTSSSAGGRYSNL